MRRIASRTAVAHVLAAAGLACGFVALWVGDILSGGSVHQHYWDDGTLGGLLLILACVAALSLLGSIVLRRRAPELLQAAAGSALFGIYLFEPITSDHVGTAGWIGACTALVPLAALFTLPGRASDGRPSPFVVAPAVVALAGAVLLLVGMWFKVLRTGILASSTYWSFGEGGTRIGVLLIVVVVAAMALLGGLLLGDPLPLAAPIAFAGVACGLTLFLPVAAAFHGFAELRDGVWIAGPGGLVLLVGATATAAARLPRRVAAAK